MVEEFGVGVVDWPDLDLPLSYSCIPPRTDDLVVELDAGVEMVLSNDSFQVLVDLLVRRVTIWKFPRVRRRIRVSARDNKLRRKG